MINLESKNYCEDFNGVRKVLIELGAKKIKTVSQKDFYFNLLAAEGKLKLRIEGKKKTFIFYTRPKFSSSKPAESVFKLFPVKDLKLFNFLKLTLGIKSIVEKKRELWKKGSAVFHMDTIKGVGNIFEFEIEVKGEIKEKDTSLFTKYQDTFKPYVGEVANASNGDMVNQ